MNAINCRMLTWGVITLGAACIGGCHGDGDSSTTRSAHTHRVVGPGDDSTVNYDEPSTGGSKKEELPVRPERPVGPVGPGDSDSNLR